MKKTNALKILISIFAIVVFVSFLFSKKEAFSGYKSTETIQIQNEPYFEEISTKCNNFATNVETNLLDYPNTKCTNYCIKPSNTWKGSCIGNYLLDDDINNCVCSENI